MTTHRTQQVPIESLTIGGDLDEKNLLGLQESFANGEELINPIIVRAGDQGGFVVIAGHHRAEAAKRAGWSEIAAVVVPFETEEDRLHAELVHINENLLRRELGAAERTLASKRRLEILKDLGEIAQRGGDRRSEEFKAGAAVENQMPQDEVFEKAKDTAKKSAKTPRAKHKIEAAALGVSKATAERVLHRTNLPKAILERVVKHKHLNKGTELDALLELPQNAQEEVLKAAEAGSKLKATTRLRQWQRSLQEMNLAGKQRSLPEKRYGVIYADPPWRWEAWSGEGEVKAAENHYPTMTLDDIMAMPVADTIAAEDCVLFLWARNDMVDVAIDVIRRWGFTFKSSIIWYKEAIGTGYWVRTKHEQLMIATRGHVPAPPIGMQPESVIGAKRGKHSAKPKVFREIIERSYPTLPKIELFQREDGSGPSKGWDVWGKEASSSGRTPEFDSGSVGSSPAASATKEAPDTPSEPGPSAGDPRAKEAAPQLAATAKPAAAMDSQRPQTAEKPPRKNLIGGTDQRAQTPFEWKDTREEIANLDPPAGKWTATCGRPFHPADKPERQPRDPALDGPMGAFPAKPGWKGPPRYGEVVTVDRPDEPAR